MESRFLHGLFIFVGFLYIVVSLIPNIIFSEINKFVVVLFLNNLVMGSSLGALFVEFPFF
jgi:hypothetical protein